MASAVEALLDTIRVHDVDTHVTEPVDLWSSRLSSRWGDDIPQVRQGDDGRHSWYVGGVRTMGAASVAVGQSRLDESSWSGSFEPNARLKWMDEHGVFSQVLYPNMIGFFIKPFLQLDPKLALECITAYNDFLTEFCSIAPDRLIPMANLPWWDLDASIAEVQRCAAMGHKGINLGWRFERLGFPPLRSEHWHPLFSAIEETGLPVNFHVGFGGNPDDDPAMQFDTNLDSLDRPKNAAMLFIGNAECIAELIMSRICHRFPTLKFVSVESGMGFVPFLLEALDWQVMNENLHKTYPDMLLPSEYFRRQIYGCFWFEKDVVDLAYLYPDNFMFESDYPHTTSLTPLASIPQVKGPRDTIIENLATVPEDLFRKLVHDNAAAVYGLS